MRYLRMVSNWVIAAGVAIFARLLERVSAGHIDGDRDRITYTQWLNEGGTLEADLTVTKLDDERFWVGVELTRSEKFIVIENVARLPQLLPKIYRGLTT